MTIPDPRPRQGGSAGFTLVELLVAGVVFGLVALVMLNGMRFVGRATASAESRREAVESTTTGLGLLRATLGRAQPMFRKVENKDRLVFEGGEDRLRLAVFEPDYMPGWPLVAYEYSIDSRGGRSLLLVRRAALDPSDPDLGKLEEADPRAILAFPGPARFAYYGAAKPKEQESWRAEWRGEGAEHLPRAVRIGPDEPAPGWPDFVVPLPIDTPAACLNANAQEAKGCGR